MPGRLLSAALVAVAIVLVGLLVRWGVARQEEPYAAPTDNTLRYYLATDPDYLNPLLRTSSDASYVFDFVHHYMLEWDYVNNEYIPRLMTHWDLSEDGLDYTFHLRPDVRWHDGEPFDAEDVLYSYRMSMDPDVPGYARSSYVDCWIRETLPPEDGDGQIAADEYLELAWQALPELADTAVLDGTPEAGAIVVAEATGGRLLAARRGSRLYLCGSLRPRHDTVIFLAKKPGEPTAYGPSTYVANWDALLFADSGNHWPPTPGWALPAMAEIPGDASGWTAGEMLEGEIDLAAVYGKDLPSAVSVVLAQLDDVQLEALDPHTVRWHFPRRIFSNLIAAGADLRLVPEHYYNTPGTKFREHPRRDEPIGLGPYRFIEWRRNDHILIERWDDYWGELEPTVERVNFKIIDDDVVAFQVFRKGDLDMVAVGSARNFIEYARDPEFLAKSYPMTYYKPGYYYAAWNNKRSFFSDARVRRAMSHLLDTRAAADNIYLGMARPITGHLFFREMGYDESLPAYEYDIEEARRLLDESGWKDSDGDGIRDMDLNGDHVISREPLGGDPNRREVFAFDILIGGSIDAQNNWVALSLQRNCKKVGIECSIRNVEFALFLNWIKARNYDASASSWGLSFEADPYDWFHSSQTIDGFNREQYSDPEMDRLIEEARAELDKEKRHALFRKVHRKLWEDQPYTFLLAIEQRWVFSRRVENVTAYDLGFNPLEWQLSGHEDGH